MTNERLVQTKLKTERVQRLLKSQTAWTADDTLTSIRRTYEFPSFRTAMAFVAYAGELAEALDHHPDIDIRYRKVTLSLTTHEAGGLTEKDFEYVRVLDPNSVRE